MTAIYPSWIEPADYHIAFFAQIRQKPTTVWIMIGCENYLLFTPARFNIIKTILANQAAPPMHSFHVLVITINGACSIDAFDFIRPTYDKFCVIRTLPLPVADEIWMHFDPVFIKHVRVLVHVE